MAKNFDAMAERLQVLVAAHEAQLTPVVITLNAQQPANYTVKGNAEMMHRAVKNIVQCFAFFIARARDCVKLAVEDRLLTISVAEQGQEIT